MFLVSYWCCLSQCNETDKSLILFLHWFLLKATQLLRVEGKNWPKSKLLLRLKITPTLEQLRLKPTSYKASLLVDEYETDRQTELKLV